MVGEKSRFTSIAQAGPVVACRYNDFPQKQSESCLEVLMDAREFFLERYDTVRFIVNDLFLKGLTDDQIRHQPKEGLNSIAWYLWHTSRWQDFANTLIATSRQQVFDQQWLARIKVARIDVGTGMTREECTSFNQAVDVLGVRAYWEAVGNAVREVARSVPGEDLIKPVDYCTPLPHA